jgi:hypothetical protein
MLVIICLLIHIFIKYKVSHPPNHIKNESNDKENVINQSLIKVWPYNTIVCGSCQHAIWTYKVSLQPFPFPSYFKASTFTMDA